jgi:hypothetical protein
MTTMLEAALLATSVLWGAPPDSPAGEVRAALADVEALSAHHQPTTRYLTLYNVPAEERAATHGVAAYVLNAVSRSARIVPPAVLHDGRLLRLDLRDYDLPPDVWEALASDREPYFHLTTQVRAPAQRRSRGSREPAVQTVYTDGGWIDLAAAAELRRLTGSGGAILRADWFVARVSTPPHYYQFAAVPATERELFAALGLDLATIDRLQADAGANLIRSGVTQKVRRLARRQGPLGGAWQTFDVERSTAERDPLRNPFAFTFDAGEHIAAKANGLHVFALYDAQGNRQDSVPDRIAKDSADPHGEGIIVPMLSCVRCHVEDGLRPFTNDQQRLLAGNVELFTTEPDAAERLAAFYDADLQKQLTRDREDYAQAVARATGGWTVAELAEALADTYAAYVHELVDAERAAAELGVDPDALQIQFSVSHDPLLLALVEGLAVQRDQFEASFAEAAVLAQGAQQP